MKKLLGSKGFSLIEVLVVMAIMSGLVMVFLKLSDKIVESERKMMDLMEMNQLSERIRYTLNDTVACNKNFSIEKRSDGFTLPVTLEKIVTRRNKVIVEKNISNGRLKIKNIRVMLEPIEGEHIVEEPRFVNLIFDIQGRSKLMKNKTLKIAVPVLLDTFEDNNYKFLYCDSLVNGVAQEMSNEIMKRMCESLSVPYDILTGKCKMDQMNLGGGLVNEEMMKQIQKMLFKK